MDNGYNTISELFEFQKYYLVRLMDNIPDEQLYLTTENINSPGWILGHLIVEVQDIANELNIDFEVIPTEWNSVFKNGKKLKNDVVGYSNLPTKMELLYHFTHRYETLTKEYLRMKDDIRFNPDYAIEVRDDYISC